jgi:hypothetical protein
VDRVAEECDARAGPRFDGQGRVQHHTRERLWSGARDKPTKISVPGTRHVAGDLRQNRRIVIPRSWRQAHALGLSVEGPEQVVGQINLG